MGLLVIGHLTLSSGFFILVASASGVREGIQKEGSCLSRPSATLDRLVPARCCSASLLAKYFSPMGFDSCCLNLAAIDSCSAFASSFNSFSFLFFWFSYSFVFLAISFFF